MELRDQQRCAASPRSRRSSALMGRADPDHAAPEDDGVALLALPASPCHGRAAATGGCHVVSSGPATSVDFAIALRKPGQPLRIEHDHHLFGGFPDATWRRLIDDGLERVDVDVDDPGADEHVVFVGRLPPAEKFRRRSRPASSTCPGRTA